MVSGLERGDAQGDCELTNSTLSTRHESSGRSRVGVGGEGGGGFGLKDVDKKIHGKQQERGGKDEKEIKIAPQLAPYYRNAVVKRLKHPLEENIFSSLFLTLIAVGVAILLGFPVLIFVGVTLITVLVLRHLAVIIVDCCHYIRLLCSNRLEGRGQGGHHNVSHAVQGDRVQIFPRDDRLAFANDVRWLGKKSSPKCQSILHTLLVFEGTMDLSSLRHLIQTRVLHAETPQGDLAYPRLIQKMKPLVTGYRWELDVHFDVQNHIFHTPANIQTEAQLQQYISVLLQETLPMGKPLWEIRVLPFGYGAQKDTLAILRVHQCLADGMTLVRILSHSLADHQHSHMHIPQRPHFAGLSFGFNVLRALIVGPLTFFLWMFMTFRDRNFFSKPLIKSNKSSSSLSSTSCDTQNKKSKNCKVNLYQVSTPPRRGQSNNMSHSCSSYSPSSDQLSSNLVNVTTEAPSGLWNVLWSASMTLPKVARVKQIMRSSFNDVMLSAAAGSVRMYLQKQGISYPDDCKVVIPVDLRNDIASPKTSTKLGCKVALVLANIPSGTEAAIPRLWSTRHRLDELKASADPVVAYGATAILMNILPHKLGTSVLESLTNKASFLFCNLPGPSTTLVVGGNSLKGIYPIYPPSGKIRVAMSIFTYADQVHITVVAHHSLQNACPCLLNGMGVQLDQLSRQLSQRRVPGESRRSARNMSTNNPEITKPPTKQIHIQLQQNMQELQQLSHRLDTVDEQTDRFSSNESLGPELRTRLKSLKTEFSELIGELRRRSSIVDGVALSFEDEEVEEDFRKPRKRALSVVSVSQRRTSIFSSRSPESSVAYSSSDEDLSSTTPPDLRVYSSSRHNSPSIRTTAV